MQSSLPFERNREEVEFINQLSNDDCVVACIAMACGVTYKDVIDIANEKDDMPLPQFKEDCLIAHFQCLPIRTIENVLYENRLYIVTVPSLNREGDFHRIIITTYDTLIVYDPNTNIPDRKAYDSESLKSWSEVTEIIRCRD